MVKDDAIGGVSFHLATFEPVTGKLMASLSLCFFGRAEGNLSSQGVWRFDCLACPGVGDTATTRKLRMSKSNQADHIYSVSCNISSPMALFACAATSRCGLFRPSE